MVDVMVLKQPPDRIHIPSYGYTVRAWVRGGVSKIGEDKADEFFFPPNVSQNRGPAPLEPPCAVATVILYRCGCNQRLSHLGALCSEARSSVIPYSYPSPSAGFIPPATIPRTLACTALWTVKSMLRPRPRPSAPTSKQHQLCASPHGHGHGHVHGHGTRSMRYAKCTRVAIPLVDRPLLTTFHLQQRSRLPVDAYPQVTQCISSV